MGERKAKNNVIPLQQAIQRELAFRNRKKDMALRLNEGNTSAKTFMPFQTRVKSFQPPGREPLPGPNSRTNPSQSPCLSGLKRKEPASSADHQPPQQPRPFIPSHTQQAHMDDLYCKVCNVSCPGQQNFEQHLRGRKHKAKLQGNFNNRGQWHCDVCKISCMTEQNLKMHLQGQQHGSMMKKLESRKRNCGEICSQRRWCPLCKIWCMDELAMEQHLQGKRHTFSLYTSEIEKKARDQAGARGLRNLE